MAVSRPLLASTVLRVGDQKGAVKSLMAASGALDGVEHLIEWAIFPAAAPLLEALNAGAIDCGGVGDAPRAFARAAGVRAGLSAGDIKLAFMSPADAKAAFIAGAIDAWSTRSRYVYLATTQNEARILLDGQEIMSGLSYQVATERAIAEKPDLLRTFTRRLEVALHWGLKNVDAYATAWSKETGVPEEVSRQTLLARGFTPASIDAAMIADQQRTIDVYVKEGVPPSRYDAAPGFDSSFNL